MDDCTAFGLGVALGEWARAHKEAGLPEVAIGMDTRESGPWLAEYVAGGLKKSGVAARFAGVITTPGIAYLTRTGPFVAGVMISASHNPYEDNGLKVISHSGYKLPDSAELELEGALDRCLESGNRPQSLQLSADRTLEPLYARYLVGTVIGRLPFQLVVDCANGAATVVAPEVFADLGSDVTWIGTSPNGRNINLDCGSLHMNGLRQRVLETGADLGIAFDGDADRALFVSGTGKIVDGDAVLFLTGTALKRAGKLPGDLVVATVMSNLGLERALGEHGVRMLRTPVGDRYVLEEMLDRGAALGGEQSGHVIFSEFSTTGDGLLTALRVLEVVRDSGKSLDELAAAVKTYPQKLVNVRVKEKRPLADLDTVQTQIRAAESEFNGTGRVVVRFSGTEPLARVMIEAQSDADVQKWTQRIADAIREELGSAD